MINTTNGLEKQEVDYKVECTDCGKDARMTSVFRDDEDGVCAFVECEHCQDKYAVPLKFIERFEAIGAAIRAARRA